ncbi:radical SAM protein [Methanoculleus sp. FWC-SCC1]|uniref:Radical SAM protein n=1 Tax=Methanoculleus frigidifontis TaxID=2584085 RepID=A0ABT8M7I6_9EURY|nr:radical SAM protein [Methanoculleus sp. FWC-SCC1]
MNRLKLKKQLNSSDQCVKFIWETSDSHQIESLVVIWDDFMSHFCSSTHVGCNLNCKMCATSNYPYVRPLQWSEIADQYIQMFDLLTPTTLDNQWHFDSIGEPLNNYEELVKAMNFVRDTIDEDLYCSISTVGVAPKIRQLADNKLHIKLQVSLHAADNETRNALIPINRIYPLEELMSSLDYFSEVTGTWVRLNYTMIKGVNDERTDLENLINLLRDRDIILTLASYNPIPNINLSKSPIEKRDLFKEELENNGIITVVFDSLGLNIEAGCGQLLSPY